MSIPGRPLWRIPFLAAADLRHQWILTLCLVIALAAVIAPLLVFLGLKHGTIQTLRERLVQDPVYREIRPTQTREFTPGWFTEFGSRPGVGFLTPTILPLSSVLSVVVADNSGALFDLVPTAAGDPLLLENGGVIPEEDEVVISAEAARQTGAGVGQTLTAKLTRSRGGRGETVEVPLRVAAVLDQRAGSLARIYAPLSFVLDVEAYKEGYAAPARGWAGETPQPYASFDGAVLLVPQPLHPIARSGLTINTGFGLLTELTTAQARALLGFAPPGHLTCYDLPAPGSPITVSSLRAIEQKLRGQTRVLLPYVRNPVIQVDDRKLHPIGLSLDQNDATLLDLPPTPWPKSGTATSDQLLACLWPKNQDRNPGEIVAVKASGLNELNFPLLVAGYTDLEQPVLPVELLGILRTAAQRSVNFDPEARSFQMARGGFRGFRLYAQSIEAVPALFYQLKNEGIEVTAEIAAIKRIQVLDQGLTRLFRLIAILGLCGGTGVLVASLYAAVERSRRELGVLRLIGFARRHVFFFPVAQGVIIAVLGLLAGFGGYAVLAGAIDRAFALDLAPGEAFCTLPADYLPWFCLTTLLLASLAALVAAGRTTRIDPAEVIREQ